ncbi:hypothetical protein HHI36_008051 [Cryptolaemus montrouzieri]|uniref:Uncharacterized protein n=1 Tax=Cryptolaemus montrouzieri TaxID=559131 RepID=A0ABD2MRF2_9CUCU
MLERKRWETNIIVANVEKSKAGSTLEQKAEDTRDEVVNVLKNKRNLTPRIIVFPDQTERQIKFFKDLKSKLGEMEAECDFSKTFRFINGNPTIVDKIRQQQLKNQ